MTMIKARLLIPIFCLTSNTEIPNVSLDSFGENYMFNIHKQLKRNIILLVQVSTKNTYIWKQYVLILHLMKQMRLVVSELVCTPTGV